MVHDALKNSDQPEGWGDYIRFRNMARAIWFFGTERYQLEFILESIKDGTIELLFSDVKF